MLCDAAVRSAIRQGGLAAADLREIAVASGMRPMVEDALGKLREGLTDLREVAGVIET